MKRIILKISLKEIYIIQFSPSSSHSLSFMAQIHLHVSNRSQSWSHLLATRHQPQVTNVAPTVATWRIIGYPEEVIYNRSRPDGIHVSNIKVLGTVYHCLFTKRAPIAKNLCVTLHLLSISKKYTTLLHQEKEKVSDPQNMFPVEIHQNHPKTRCFQSFC